MRGATSKPGARSSEWSATSTTTAWDRKPSEVVYWPTVQPFAGSEPERVQRWLAFVLRSERTGQTSLLGEIRQAVASVNPNLPLARIRTLEEILRRSMARTSFTLVMLGIAAAVAPFARRGRHLRRDGLHRVAAHPGNRSEDGAGRSPFGRWPPRAAPGARACRLRCGRGLGAAAGLTRLMSALLFGVSSVDPLTYGLVAVGLVLSALPATWIPARRASTVDPMVALRAE